MTFDKSKNVLFLATLAFLLLITASIGGILLDDGGSPRSVHSLRGDDVELYGGSGLYQYDTVYKAVLFRGFDWANLIVGLPLLIWGLWLFIHRRLKGQILLAAVFTYLAYNYLIGVMGNSFNIMFLVWTCLYSVGIFGLVAILPKMSLSKLPAQLGINFPRKSLSIYVILLGLILLTQYLVEILSAHISGQVPGTLGIYTTLELASLELGIMIPLHIFGGIMLWNKKPAGYLIAVLMAFTAFMTFVAISIAMLMLYFCYSAVPLANAVPPFVLTLIASTFTVVIFRQISEN